ncbi:MAG: thioredoxin family protein [Chloroflexota bacterium]
MSAPTGITPEFFYSGMNINEYINGMTKNRELFEENYRTFEMDGEEVAAFREVEQPTHVLVLTEDWCGDAMRYLPALVRLAETAQRWDVRIFYRDAHPDLAERWLKQGKHRAIPVLVFLDENWKEYACFVEKPALVYAEELAARAIFADDNSDLPDAALPAGEMSQSTHDLFAPYMRGFRLENTNRWQHLFISELTQRMGSATTSDAVGAGCW